MLKIGNFRVSDTNSIKNNNTKTPTVNKVWEDPFYMPPKRENAYARGVRKFIPGAIKYGDMEIPIYKILCLREAPDSYIEPRTVVTFLMPNPKDDDTNVAVEYEFSGSLRQWANAYEDAGNTGNTISLIV